MMPAEKEQLLALFHDNGTWCRHAEARDANGDAVRYDEEAAVAWDITGALCRLFGWRRACVLFVQLDRHINGKRASTGWPARDVGMEAMSALQDYNDRPDMTFDGLRQQIESMPVWHGHPRELGMTEQDGGVSMVES